MTVGSVVPISLQVERLRRAVALSHTARMAAIVALGLFILLLVFQFPIPLAMVLIALPSAGLVFYSGSLLESRSLSCPQCKALTRLNLFWVCGFCAFEHTMRHVVFGHTFLESCARPGCGRKQTSFICWACHHPILLDEKAPVYDREKSAYHPDYPPPPAPAPVIKDRPPKPIDEHLR